MAEITPDGIQKWRAVPYYPLDISGLGEPDEILPDGTMIWRAKLGDGRVRAQSVSISSHVWIEPNGYIEVLNG